MKPHLRRAEGAYPYYKLAVWDPISLTFRDGKQAFFTQEAALRSAPQGKAGRYRLSVIDEDGRRDLPPFEVGEMVGGD